VHRGGARGAHLAERALGQGNKFFVAHGRVGGQGEALPAASTFTPSCAGPRQTLPAMTRRGSQGKRALLSSVVNTVVDGAGPVGEAAGAPEAVSGTGWTCPKDRWPAARPLGPDPPPGRELRELFNTSPFHCCAEARRRLAVVEPPADRGAIWNEERSQQEAGLTLKVEAPGIEFGSLGSRWALGEPISGHRGHSR
jgi:hypothetical protein